MKRFVAYILMAAVVIALGAGVIAEELELTYTIDSNSYVVSVPTTLNLNEEQTFRVELKDCHSSGVSYYVESTNGMTLYNSTANNSIAYTIDPYPVQSTPITLTNLDWYTNFTVNIGSTIKQAGGDYTDTLTFHFTPIP